MKPMFCITAINRLTKERERVSAVSSDEKTLGAMKDTFLRTPPKKRTHIYPVISTVELKIF